MNPLTMIAVFFLLILVVFGLIELNARSAVRKFEQTIKHSQE